MKGRRRLEGGQEREQGDVKRLLHMGSTLWGRSHRETSIQAGLEDKEGSYCLAPLAASSQEHHLPSPPSLDPVGEGRLHGVCRDKIGCWVFGLVYVSF